MVGRIITAHTLKQLTCAVYEKMAGHAKVGNHAEKRMLARINLILKQSHRTAAAILKRRQRNIVYHHQIGNAGARAEIGRRALVC